MKRGCPSIIFALLMAISLPAYADQDSNEILKAIVKIRSTIPDDARSAPTLGTEREGTGVVIDSQGHILTIGYLIMEAETIEVFGPDGHPVKATSVGYDDNTGFGLLRTDKPLSVTPIELGQSSEVKEGDRVLVAGHGGLESVQGAWVIFHEEFAAYWEYLLEDAIFAVPVHPNFGGAALIDRNRRLVGIGSLFAQVLVPGIGSIQGNIFVPIDHLKPILADLISKGRPQVPPRPWLGLYLEERHEHIIVSRVTSESPAEKAGLQAGDIILAVNKKAVSGLADFYRKLWALGNAGVEVPLSVLQGIEIHEITVHSADRYLFFHLKPKKRV